MESENERQIAGQTFPPVYPHDRQYAIEHGEMEQWRTSLDENMACGEAIDKTILEYFDGHCLNCEAAKSVLAAFGAERVSRVLAATILSQPGERRFSRDNQEWAGTIPVPDTAGWDGDCSVYAARSHPCTLDVFIRHARKEMEAAREARRDERKPSIRAQLASAKAAQAEKPAAPHHKKDKEAR